MSVVLLIFSRGGRVKYVIILQNTAAVNEESVIYSEQTGLKGHYLSAGGGVEGDGE